MKKKGKNAYLLRATRTWQLQKEHITRRVHGQERQAVHLCLSIRTKKLRIFMWLIPNDSCVGLTCSSLIWASWSRRCLSSVALRSCSCRSSSVMCATSLAERFACSTADFSALALSSKSLCSRRKQTRANLIPTSITSHTSVVAWYHVKSAIWDK